MVPLPETLIDRIWGAHVVSSLPGGYDLLHVDRHLVHDLGGPFAFAGLEQRSLPMQSPALTFATADHCVSSAPGRTESTNPSAKALLPLLRSSCAGTGVTFFDIDSADQGIVHVIAPELGIAHATRPHRQLEPARACQDAERHRLWRRPNDWPGGVPWKKATNWSRRSPRRFNMRTREESSTAI